MTDWKSTIAGLMALALVIVGGIDMWQSGSRFIPAVLAVTALVVVAEVAWSVLLRRSGKRL
jgi:hypothetical protein